MIDGVRLSAFVDDPLSLASRLERRRTTTPTDPYRLPIETGYVRTLRASLQGNKLRLKGSLPSFMGMASPLSRQDVERARLLLEVTLGTDLSGALVRGIELTFDLRLSRPVAVYLPLLLRRKLSQKVEYGGKSVIFRTGARRFSFYDKVAERKKAKKSAPLGNVLRAELQYRRELRKHLSSDGGPVTFKHLHTSMFWTHLVDHWQSHYEQVEMGRVALPFGPDVDIRRTLPMVGLAIVGYEVAESSILASQAEGRLSRTTAYARRDWLRSLMSDPALTGKDERVTELDAAIREALSNARRQL